MNRIIVLDDEKSIRILFKDELTEEGYDVITRADGSKILDLIEQERPDLIVMDIRLGEHNGLDLLQDIRNTFYDLPVILCSAYSVFKQDIRSIAADYYVIKSSNLAELKARIRMALESSAGFLSIPAEGEMHAGQTAHAELTAFNPQDPYLSVL